MIDEIGKESIINLNGPQCLFSILFGSNPYTVCLLRDRSWHFATKTRSFKVYRFEKRLRIEIKNVHFLLYTKSVLILSVFASKSERF